MNKITGSDMIEWGFEAGPWFKTAIQVANEMRENGCDDQKIIARLNEMKPADLIRLHSTPTSYGAYANPETDAEIDNINAVRKHMDALMRVPTIQTGAFMPDACPAGNALGTIPVGGVVACENAIHPGFHSADICCSVAISVFDHNVDPSQVLDVAAKVSHFGPGGRTDVNMDDYHQLNMNLRTFSANPFLAGLESRAKHHFMTQGDGNHFFFVGDIDGHMAIVTHHGSRGLGADLYKRGKACAEKMTSKIAQGIPAHQSWIVADSQEGEDYWAALQKVRWWTKLNHFAIHDAVAASLNVRIADRWWNEHNFVFQKSDGLFYHAKGATPSYSKFSNDDIGLTLIPLNMAAGVLVADHWDFTGPKDALGFCPHGAGRNMSRSEHMRKLQAEYGDSRGLSPLSIEQVLNTETSNIDARFWNGNPDLSELPSAYKNADQIVAEIETQGLAQIKHRITPLGSIMAGENKTDWKAIKAKKKLKQEQNPSS